MELTSFNAQLADGTELCGAWYIGQSCTVSFKLINESHRRMHPNKTCRVKCCVIPLPPQEHMLLRVPLHRDHSLQLRGPDEGLAWSSSQTDRTALHFRIVLRSMDLTLT